MKPTKALAAYALASIVFLLGVFSLYGNLKPQLQEADSAIKEGHALVLKKGVKEDQISNLLYNQEYLPDRKDANLVASTIKRYLDKNGSMPNLGTLMKPELKVTADTALAAGGEIFKLRVLADYQNLGLTEEAKTASATTFEMPGADAEIIARVKNKAGKTDRLDGIPVKLREYYYTPSYSYKYSTDPATGKSVKTDSTEAGKELHVRVLGYALTDASGAATFKVKKGGFYSVLPVKEGYQYGRPKGTSDEALGGSLERSFVQAPHSLSLLAPQTFSNIKLDRAMTVRTPAEFKDSLIGMTLTYILGWGAFLLFAFQIDRKRKTHTDYLLIITVMIISGIGLLASFGIWNPLTDTLYGSVMANGLLVGLAAMAALMALNYARLDARLSASKYLLLRNYGWVSLAAAVGLLVLLYLFGSGPEGSDAKVNLFGMQPSEMARLLIIIFIAWFFARKGSLLQEFTQRLTKRTARRQLTVISWVMASILVLMGIYLKLSDMGPALVVLLSFIFIYSMARRDFAQLLLGLTSFIALMLLARWVNNSLPTLLTAAVLWFAAWIIGWYVKKREIYESAIFINFVIVIFSLAGPILQTMGMNSLADRLTNRTDISWEGVWSNEVLGGDQVVQGIWSLATGGFTGLGLGNGSPSIVPAGHTDMIFNSVGEMLGLVGLLLVVLCFFVLIHRTLLIGRRAGYPFPFYLATGIGIVTGVQFLVIVGGSLGLLPLTGVTLPFLSYGRVSLIMSLASFGFVVSVSRLRAATAVQREYTYSFNGSMMAASGLFMLICVVFLATAARYQIFSRGATLIRPAYVTNMEGARIVEYNPRIGLVLRKLEAGNIYDRNGLLLATSSRQTLAEKKDSLLAAGVDQTRLDGEYAKRKRRYYPFGDHLLFMLGDYNTLKVFSSAESNPTGYLAESRHLSDLRGIEIPSEDTTITAHKFKEAKFVDKVEKDFKVRKYDYSNLLKAGFLDYGIERNPVIEKHNKNRGQRDLTLTVDASLQTRLQNAMAEAIKKDNSLSGKKLLRASVVVLDAKKGDLLSSANYPLPNQEEISFLNDSSIFGNVPFEKLPGHAPITERDLGLTFQSPPGSTAKVMSAMAAFMGHGTDAANLTYDISPYETIEPSTVEPWGPAVSMETAIVKSSNCYFINLLHDRKLYPQIDSIYSKVGIRVHPDSGIVPGNKNITPYYFNIADFNTQHEFSSLVDALGTKAVSKYENYMRNRQLGKHQVMNFGETQAAWGQGPILATPLNMARIASIVANDGKLTPTRYVLGLGDKKFEPESPKELISAASARILKSYMQKESDKHRGNGKALPLAADNTARMGGKTGTPERPLPQRMWDRKNDPKKSNDAWYMFFIESEKQGSPLAVAVRLERTEGLNSGQAVNFVSSVVIPTLNDAGYKVK